MKGKFILKGICFGILFIAAIFGFGYIVMRLWNWLMPEIFGLHVISYCQAFGLLILSKILFGGFHGRGRRHCGCGSGGWGRKRAWKARWEEKWMKMTPEEREKFKRSWGGRCGYGEEMSEPQAKQD